MSRGPPIIVLQISPEDRAELERRVRAGTTPQRDVVRARIVLLRADGMKQKDVGREVGLSTTSVNKWSQRFARHGLEGLKDQPGRGRKPSIPRETVEKVVVQSGQLPPGQDRWSVRTMAAEAGISAASVQRIWKSNDIKPHAQPASKRPSGKRRGMRRWEVHATVDED